MNVRDPTLEAAPSAAESQPFLRPPETDQPEVNLRGYLSYVLAHKWFILFVVALSTGVGYVQFLQTAPVYQANALIQLERRTSRSSLMGFNEVTPVCEGGVSSDTQIEIMKSRMVMSKVVERLHLDIVAQPVYFPRFGEAIARTWDPSRGVSAPWFDRPEYAWGGEAIEVNTLELPSGWGGRSLTLVAGEAGRFEILDPAGQPFAAGKVGERVRKELSDGGELVLFVSQLKARPSTRFTVARASVEGMAIGLGGRLFAKEKAGGGYGGGTTILDVGFTAGESREAASVLNEILNTYVRFSVEEKTEEAEKTLGFLQGLVPHLKERLEAAEDAFNSYRLEYGALDIDKESANLLQDLISLETQLFALDTQREELRQLYKPEHPKVQSVDRLRQRLQEKRSALEQEMQTLPKAQQDVLRLSRDVEANNKMYLDLLNRVQQLRIAKAGTVGNVRVIDTALPSGYRIGPVLKKMLTTAAIVGLALGVGLVLLRRLLSTALEDPDQIERQLGLPVFAVIPHSAEQVKIHRAMVGKKRLPGVLIEHAQDDVAAESFRGLRTSLHFVLMDTRSPSVLITGPTEEVGKSFIAVNLAAVLAKSGERVLLVDGDLRKGHLDRYLGLSATAGLSEWLSGQLPLEQVIHNSGIENLDFVPVGRKPPNPSELLLTKRLAELMEYAVGRYAHVIVDGPPILAVTDAAIIGRVTGATLMVARSGRHHLKELELSIKRLQQGGVNVRGFVFNGVQARRRYGYYGRHRYGYGYGYRYKPYAYGYSYRSKSARGPRGRRLVVALGGGLLVLSLAGLFLLWRFGPGSLSALLSKLCNGYQDETQTAAPAPVEGAAPMRPAVPPGTSTPGVLPSASVSEPPMAEPTEPVGGGGRLDESGVAPSLPAGANWASGSVPAPGGAAPDVSAPGRVVLEFTGPSRVDIRDSTQSYRLKGQMRAGDRHELGGVPPYSFKLGNVAAVRMTINGEPFDLKARSRGGTARFTLGPESIR